MREADTRKVQQVGGTTLTVSIPKEWADAVSLEAGDEVTFTPNEDGSLTLKTDHDVDTGPVAYRIDADTCENGLLKRLIVAGYIIGYEKIYVDADTFSHDTIDAVRTVARRLTGLDIIDQTETCIELHNFMEVSRSDVYVLMRRLQTTVLHMLDSCVYALVQGRADLLDEVTEMEDDIDVLYWLVLRQLLSAVDDPSAMDDAGIESPLHIVGNRTTIKSLEGIADSIEGLSEEISFLIEAEIGLERGQQEELAEMTRKVHTMIEDVTGGLIDQDIEQVNAVLEQESIHETAGQTLMEGLDDVDTDVIVAVNKVLWHMGQIETYCSFIAEIAINRSMEGASAFGSAESE